MDFIYYEDGSLMGNNKVKFYGEGAKYEGMFENVNDSCCLLSDL